MKRDLGLVAIAFIFIIAVLSGNWLLMLAGGVGGWYFLNEHPKPKPGKGLELTGKWPDKEFKEGFKNLAEISGGWVKDWFVGKKYEKKKKDFRVVKKLEHSGEIKGLK